jgi:hypothetical protein
VTESLPPPPPLVSGNDPARMEEVKTLGWNWGGFLLPYFWLVGHGRASLGLALIFTFSLPFVGLFHLALYPAAAIYLGLNGYELAWRHQPYHSVEQLRLREHEWTLWGIAFNAAFVIAVLLFLVYLRTAFQEVVRQLPGLGI